MKTHFFALIIVLLGDLCHGYACPEYDVDFEGNELSDHQSSGWEECGRSCALDPYCKFWTWNEPLNHCWLKSSDAGLQKDPNHISGALGCP